MKTKILGFLTLLTAAFTLPAVGSNSVVTDQGAWCWFADPRAIHYSNPAGTIDMSWIGYIDVHGNIKATQYDFKKKEKKEVLVRSYFQPDDHNNPTFLVLPDERVLIIYSRHTDEPAFYYRVSKRPGDITDLGEERKIVTKNNTTYPSPFILSDDPEHFYLCWRGIGWHPTIARFTLPDKEDNVKADWGPYQMVQSTGARPYAKYHSNGKDKIYFTYTTGHPDNEMPNWLYMNVVNINATPTADGVKINPQLEDIKGNVLSTISDGKFKVSKTQEYRDEYPLTVVDAPADRRDWVWQIETDKAGNPVIAMVRINDKKDVHVYYLAKWTGENWRITPLAYAGGHFHSSPQTERCYSGGEAIDPQDTNNLYLSLPTYGKHGRVYEIWKYRLADNGTVDSKEQITKDSEKNNIRPYVLPDSEKSPLRLGWMNGDYYYWIVKKGYPQGFPTGIMCDMAAFPESKVQPKSATMKYTSKSGPSEQTLIDIPGFKYTVDSEYRPIATLDGKTYKSSNLFISSDNWATNATGTSGDYWPTTGIEYTLTFQYDGKNLTVLRDGAIDQVIPAPGFNFQRLVKALQ